MVTEFSDKKNKWLSHKKPRIDETSDLDNAVINGKKSLFLLSRLLMKKISKNEQNEDCPKREVAKSSSGNNLSPENDRQ